MKRANRCGTYDGYNDHHKAADETCDDCRDAAATYQVLRRRRIALGMPVKGHDVAETPHWFEVAGDLPTVGATIRRAFLESA